MVDTTNSSISFQSIVQTALNKPFFPYGYMLVDFGMKPFLIVFLIP